MRPLATILKWLILLPVFAAVIALAVANSQVVTVHLNPFDTADPVLRFDLRLYQLLFAVFAAGVVVGGIIAWARRRPRRPVVAPEPPRDWRSERATSTAVTVPPAPAAAASFLPRPERT